jgi:hypothetical protein
MHCAVHDTVLPNSSDDVIAAFRIAWTHEARSANSQVNKAGAGRNAFREVRDLRQQRHLLHGGMTKKQGV